MASRFCCRRLDVVILKNKKTCVPHVLLYSVPNPPRDDSVFQFMVHCSFVLVEFHRVFQVDNQVAQVLWEHFD